MRHLVKLLTAILLIIFITACSEDKGQENVAEGDNHTPSQANHEFSHQGQNFDIIPFYNEILEYTGVMKENSELDNKEVFTEKVFKPFKGKSSLDYLNMGDTLSPSSEVEQLEKNTNELLQKQEEINTWIEEALVESAEILPGEDTVVYVFPVNPEDWFTTDNLEGVAGVTYFGNNMLLQIDPSVSEEVLKYTVAHEYHHTINMSMNGEQSIYSLLDAIITEGKADSFAGIVYPEKEAPWTEALPKDAQTAVLKELSKSAESTDWNVYNDFAYGNPALGIPRWSNYKIGHQITESYLENNPNISIMEWTKLDAKEIVEGSEYNDLLK